MKKEDLFEILGELDDDIVEGAKDTVKKKVNRKVWGAVAACLCLLVIGAAAIRNPYTEPDREAVSPQPGNHSQPDVLQAENNPKESVPVKENVLMVNELESLGMADMDVECTSYARLTQSGWKAIMEDFYQYTGISYEDFTAGIPDIWKYSDFYSLSIPGYRYASLSKEYRLHDYVFDFWTEDGGEARIALCSTEKPLRDCVIVCDNPKQSEINGVPVVIYGFRDWFMAEFSCGNVYYDVETSGIGLEELEELFSGILSALEPVSREEEQAS